MWKLIKSELKYNRLYIIAAFSFSFLILSPYFFSGDILKYNNMYYPAALVFWMFFFGRWGSYMFYKDNLERVHASLPLSQKKIALARLGTGIVLWYALLSIVLIIYIFFSQVLDAINYWGIFLINGLAITFNSFIYVWHDFIFQKPGKNRKKISYLFYYPVAFSTIAIIYFSTSATFSIFSDLQESMRNIFFSAWSAILANIIGIGLTILSYRMYQTRYSYLLSEFGLKSNIRVKTGDIT